MKTALALVIALAGLAASASALQDTPKAAPKAPPATQTTPSTPSAAPSTPPAPPAPPAPSTPPAPKGIAVPDMPVVKTETREGGLIVEDLKIGEGAEVKEGGAVVAYYHGTRKSDGHVFDSAFERGEPMAFSLNQVVAGWQKGVPGMRVGGVRRLTIPSALGYGKSGSGPDIPPDTDLVFVIQVEDSVQVEDVKVGDGEAATDSCVAVTTHTIKDKDGKEIEKADMSKPYVWIPGEFRTQLGYDAMQGGVSGMKVGGRRKIHMPAGFNQPNPGLGITRAANVPLEFEVELVAVRNLPSGRRR